MHRFRRSIVDFLALPVLIVLAFVVLAEVVDWLDNHAGSRAAWGPLRLWLSQYAGDTQSAIGVLTAIAGSLFTVTSVTFSILLLAVQQGATVLNSQIVDHYLRRRSNRAWFGFFIGVSIFVLITLVQTTHTKAPVFGVTVSTLLGAATLTTLVVLIYATVDQTRPATVMQAIAQTALAARAKQAQMLERTAPAPRHTAHPCSSIACPTSGYLVAIDIRKLTLSLADQPAARVCFMRSIGDYVPEGAPLANVQGLDEQAVLDAVTLSSQRDLATDPSCSLDHLATIGWTAISTARSDPAVGAIAVHALQQLLHAWSKPTPRLAETETAQIRYHDRLPEQTMNALESLIVAATESRQHQTLALLFQTLGTSLPVLSEAQQLGVCAMVRTAAPALAEHLPTGVLQASTITLADALHAVGAHAEATVLRQALSDLLQGRG